MKMIKHMTQIRISLELAEDIPKNISFTIKNKNKSLVSFSLKNKKIKRVTIDYVDLIFAR